MAKKNNIITKQQMVAIKDSTGKILDTAKVTMIVQRDVPKYRGEPFTLLFQGINNAISRNIKPLTAKILLYMCSISEYNNFIDRTVDELCEDLSYTKKWVISSLKELEEANILIKHKHPTDKRRHVYSLHPGQSWKGEVKERKKRISELDPKQLQMFPNTEFTIKEPVKTRLALSPNTEFLPKE